MPTIPRTASGVGSLTIRISAPRSRKQRYTCHVGQTLASGDRGKSPHTWLLPHDALQYLKQNQKNGSPSRNSSSDVLEPSSKCHLGRSHLDNSTQMCHPAGAMLTIMRPIDNHMAALSRLAEGERSRGSFCFFLLEVERDHGSWMLSTDKYRPVPNFPKIWARLSLILIPTR